MGEGGSVNIISDKKLSVICESFRDWGRDCWCPSGVDNTCNKRFDWQLGDLPAGYDHKYTYSHLGYNLKPLDPQAAIGRVQLNRLDSFIQMRKYNWQYLRSGLDSLSEFLEFTLPTHAKKWNPDGSYEWDDSGCLLIVHGLASKLKLSSTVCTIDLNCPSFLIITRLDIGCFLVVILLNNQHSLKF